MSRSLKARLLALALAATAAVWIGTLVVTWVDARHEIDELLDAHLAQAAALLIAQLGSEPEEIDTEHVPLLHREARKVAFQVWQDGTALRLHSANAPQTPLGTKREGFSDRDVDGRRWRVFSAWDTQHRYLVHVGEDARGRRAIAQAVVAGMLRPLFVALPLLGLLLWIAIGRGLRPLQRLTGEVARRDPANLAPIPGAQAPREVAPLIDQLNRLFARIAESFERERRFTADAAHELRTPVAAIKAQAQVAQLAASDAARRHALGQVLAGAERIGRLVDQLLTLARLEAVDRGKLQRADLRVLALQTVAELAPSALARGVTVELAAGESVEAPLLPELIQVLLRNLVDNAVRHGGPGTCVTVSVAAAPAEVLLVVADTGPGIPPDQREAVFERFRRLADAGEGGSGLGLSIVQRIAELHGGRVELEDGPAGKGLEVRVHLPR